MNIFCHCCRESQREACRQASFCCCCCKPAGIAAWAWCRWGEPGKPRRRRRGGDKGGWPGSGRWRWWFWCQKRWLREFGANKLPLTLEIAQLSCRHGLGRVKSTVKLQLIDGCGAYQMQLWPSSQHHCNVFTAFFFSKRRTNYMTNNYKRLLAQTANLITWSVQRQKFSTSSQRRSTKAWPCH